jgi:hypothetical protein
MRAFGKARQAAPGFVISCGVLPEVSETASGRLHNIIREIAEQLNGQRPLGAIQRRLRKQRGVRARDRSQRARSDGAHRRRNDGGVPVWSLRRPGNSCPAGQAHPQVANRSVNRTPIGRLSRYSRLTGKVRTLHGVDRCQICRPTVTLRFRTSVAASTVPPRTTSP